MTLLSPAALRAAAASATLAALLAGQPALAQEEGTLTLEIGGVTGTFMLWGSQSDWSGSASDPSVNIYARPADEATRSAFAVFTLGFYGLGTAGESAEATVQKADGARLWSKVEQGALGVRVDSASAEGDFLSISGTVEGQMGTSESFGRDIDLSSPAPLSGTFSVTLGPVE